jgi:hypothetical protein
MAGGRFAAGMREALDHAVEACIDDAHGRLGGTKTVELQGPFPYLNADLRIRGIVVQEKPGAMVVRLALGDVMVFAGTHVLNPADYKVTPVDFKDPRK